MKEKYVIYSASDDMQIIKEFKYYMDCHQWVVNHLDLSKNWNFDRLVFIESDIQDLLSAFKHGYTPTVEQEKRLRAFLDNESLKEINSKSLAVI